MFKVSIPNNPMKNHIFTMLYTNISSVILLTVAAAAAEKKRLDKRGVRNILGYCYQKYECGWRNSILYRIIIINKYELFRI